MWIKAATSRTRTEHEHTTLSKGWWKNLTCFHYFGTGETFFSMHTLFMQITSNLFDCNFMLPLHHQCQLLHGQHQRMDLYGLWVLSWNLRRQWQSVLLEPIEILCDVDLMSCDSLVHFQIHYWMSENLVHLACTMQKNQYRHADLISNHHQLLLPIAVFMRLVLQIFFYK